MKEHKRRTRLLKIFAFILRPFFRHKFNYSYDPIDVKGPYILVCNHNTDFDPVFLGLAVRDFVYVVATENVTRLGFFSKVVEYCFHPIIHYKGKKGINTVKEMLNYLKFGYNVGIFPEGNRSFTGITNDFVSTIGKVVKKSGATLVTYRLVGGYFSQPRWGTTIRKGKVKGELIHVYYPDELSNMDDKAINEAISNDIHEDAYLEQKTLRQPYKGKKLAYGLESAIFVCPECKRINTLKSDYSYLMCDCGYKAEYDVYGYVGGKSISELDSIQREVLSNSDIMFSDDVTVEEIGEDHKVKRSYSCTLSASNEGLFLDNNKIDIVGLEIFSRNTLILSTNDNYYNITGSIGFNALKYKYLYEKI